jgi:membrane-associated phospholipid phosphatase
MNNFFHNVRNIFNWENWEERWDRAATKEYIVNALKSFFYLAVSLVLNYFASRYAVVHMSSPVRDLFLDIIPRFDVTTFFVYSTLLGLGFLAILMLFRFEEIPFVVKSLALFILIRSAFVTLTHIAPFPDRNFIDPSYLLEKITSGGDLFFSGHTGMPYLLALIYWNKKLLRRLFLTVSVVYAVTVLIGHLHYSIDVFAAYFITYAIYHLSLRFFAGDREQFINSGGEVVLE